MVALDGATGEVRWRGGHEVAAYAAPMLASIAGTRQVVNFMADAVVGFEAATGRVPTTRPRWKTAIVSQTPRSSGR